MATTTMQAGLSPLDRAKLNFPFDLADHEFLQGFVYIQEEAIAARLDKIDLDWTWKITDKAVVGDAVAVFGTLTINGIPKDGVGGQAIQRSSVKKGDFDQLTVGENVVNAFKGAATDAFKRAARLHGVGRSLLQAPKENNDFPTWLQAQTNAAMPELIALMKAESERNTQAIPAVAPESQAQMTAGSTPAVEPVLAPIGNPQPAPAPEPIPAVVDETDNFSLPPLPPASGELYILQAAEFGIENIEQLKTIAERLGLPGYTPENHYDNLFAMREYADAEHVFDTVFDGDYNLEALFPHSPDLQAHIDTTPPLKGAASVRERRAKASAST